MLRCFLRAPFVLWTSARPGEKSAEVRLRMEPWLPPAAIAIVLFALAACRDIPTDAADPASIGPGGAVAPAIQFVGGVRTFDDEMAATANRVPGFAGLYLDPSGQLVVRMTDPPRLAQASAEIENLLGRVSHRGPDLASERSQLVAGMRAELADYDFAQLHVWFREVVRDILGMDGITFGDIDEVRNRIVVGVRDGSLVGQVQREVVRLAVPAEAVEVKVVEPPVLDRGPSQSLTLEGSVRPVIGGIQVTASWQCTLGYNVVRTVSNGHSDGERYLMTNSHCADSIGAVAPGAPIHQPAPWDTIGMEFADPGLFTNVQDPACPTNRWCRYSDAALFKYDATTTWTHARIAWPNLGTSSPHPFTLVREVESTGDPLVGMTVHKVGQTTGRTSGPVTATCATLPLPDPNGVRTDLTLLCQGQAEYWSRPGDSGSPVVSELPGSNAHVVERGIHWGRTGDRGNFSLGREARLELQGSTGGTLHTSFAPTVQIEGPTPVPPGMGCWYTSVVSGGTTPMSYQWSGLGSGTGSSAFLVLNTSGWLHLTVHDSGARSDQTSFFITVDPSASPPPGCIE